MIVPGLVQMTGMVTRLSDRLKTPFLSCFFAHFYYKNVYLAWFTKRTWKLLVVCVLCPLPFPKIINWLGFLLQKHNKNIRAPVSLGKPKVLLKT